MRKIFSKIKGLIFFLPSTALAVSVDDFSNVDPIDINPNVESMIVNIINFILKFSAALAVLFLIIGGVMYMTSAGNDDKIKSAKNILKAAIIGLVIVILAIVIVNFVTKSTNQVVQCNGNQIAVKVKGKYVCQNP